MIINIWELRIPWEMEYFKEYLAVLENELRDWENCWNDFMKWKPDSREIKNQKEVKANLVAQIAQLKEIMTKNLSKTDAKKLLAKGDAYGTQSV